MQMRHVLAVLGSLLLTSCFFSEEPLMPDANKVAPYISGNLGELTGGGGSCSPTRIARTVYPKEDNPDAHPAEAPVTFDLERSIPNPFGGSSSTKIKYRVAFDRLFEDWYLVQLQEWDGDRYKAETTYRIAHHIRSGEISADLKWTGPVWAHYQPTCTGDIAAMDGAGSNDGEKCGFSDYAPLRQVAETQARRLAASNDLADIGGVFLEMRSLGSLSCVLSRR